ncbi:MAG: 5-formyltetrahydrofolate cyclo-ligase [Nocardioides sp.]|nr:5-formyltetrahydrofolate cyclo-ligase [Nocardioides sp.]
MAVSQPPAGSGGRPTERAIAKVAIRDQLTTARNHRPDAERGVASRAVCWHTMEAPEVAGAATVAAYVSFGSEPGTSWLLNGLLEQGKRVLLPVLLPDGDLDWAELTGDPAAAGVLEPGRMGLREPVGPRLGVDAVRDVDAMVLPGLAVDDAGVRLGRGGGSYDRALARVGPGAFTMVLLYDEEVGLVLPVEPHDRAVDAVVTPSGKHIFP